MENKKHTLQNISAACVLFNSVLDVRFSFLRGLESYLFSNNFHFVMSSPSRKNVVTVISPASLSSFRMESQPFSLCGCCKADIIAIPEEHARMEL